MPRSPGTRSAGARSAVLLLAALLSASLTGAASSPPGDDPAGSTAEPSITAVAGTTADTAAPVVDGLTVTPSTVDLTDGPSQATLRVHITDETGTEAPLFWVNHSLTGQPLETMDTAPELVEGTVQDGVWELVVLIPTDVPNGTWHVMATAYADVLDNQDGDHRDAFTTFTVTGGTVTDLDAPVVGSVTATPHTLDLTTGPRELTVRARVTDESGTFIPYMTVESQDVRVPQQLIDLEQTSGTLKDGWWTGTVTLPADSPNGAWTARVTAPYDINHNYWGDLNSSEVTFDVTGSTRTDYEAPVVQNQAVTPAAWNLEDGDAIITVTADLSDPAGTREAGLFFSSEKDDVTGEPFAFQSSMELVSGTAERGTWRGQFTIPEGAPGGSYGITLDVTDALGNWETLSLDPVVMSYGTVPAEPAEPADPAGPEPEVEFSDVADSAWYFDPVNWMVGRGITTGYKDGTFKPYKPVTRGEAVTFLYRYVDDEDFTVPGSSGLTDVPSSHNFFEAISWATSRGVVTGYSDNTFRSGTNMTRGQVAAVLYRQAAPDYSAPATSTLTDVVQGETNFYDAISWMVEEEITTGRANGTFDPGANVTRAELATFLKRYNTVRTG
ncbi:S-layer homology domain-containing protein [Microbacterium sp. A93]|uniref:S-layer homology domain-containing protein n=1 Tax=Microbacterium sp. A93 TaxID=3450716 RepID=UPI003F43C67B